VGKRAEGKKERLKREAPLVTIVKWPNWGQSALDRERYDRRHNSFREQRLGRKSSFQVKLSHIPPSEKKCERKKKTGVHQKETRKQGGGLQPGKKKARYATFTKRILKLWSKKKRK